MLFIFLLAGSLLGFLGRKKKKIVSASRKISEICVFLLVFFLGAFLGKNPAIRQNFALLTWKSFVLCLCLLIGTITTGYFLNRFFGEK